jgi:hypothetical protein
MEKRMTAVFVLYVMFQGWMFKRDKLAFFVGLTVFFGGLCYKRQDLLAAKGMRLKMWAHYFDYFTASGKSIWLGFGPGTFEMIGPKIKIPNPVVPGNQNGPPEYATAWMHNDWLQILWEYGAIVFMISVAFYFYLLVRSYKQTWLFCMVLGYGACMCFYSPIHFFLSQLLACTLIVECLRKKGGLKWLRRK